MLGQLAPALLEGVVNTFLRSNRSIKFCFHFAVDNDVWFEDLHVVVGALMAGRLDEAKVFSMHFEKPGRLQFAHNGFNVALNESSPHVFESFLVLEIEEHLGKAMTF